MKKYVLRRSGMALSGFYPNGLPERCYSRKDGEIHLRYSDIFSFDQTSVIVFDTRAEAEAYKQYILDALQEDHNHIRYLTVDDRAPHGLRQIAESLKISTFGRSEFL